MALPSRAAFSVLCLVLVPAFLVLAEQPPRTPRPISIADYFQIRVVSDPDLSPEGGFVTYTVESRLLKEDKNEDRIWMVPTAGGEAVPLTAAGASSSHARWSPDGKSIAFLSARNEGNTQVWRLPRLAGEAERLQFKMDDIGDLDRRRTHLYVFDLAAKSLTQITSGDFDDSEPAWSPDGRSIAFSSNRSQPDPDATYDINIWVVRADTHEKEAHLTQITTNPGADTAPSWSPDGKWITYVTQLDPHLSDYAVRHVAVAPATGGSAKVLTLTLDRNADEPHCSSDGKIFFIADDDGALRLYTVNPTTGAITFGDGERGERPSVGRRLTVNGYSIGNGSTGNIAAQISTLDHPDEIFSVIGGKLTRITHMNDALMNQLKLSHGEYVHFKSKDG